MTMMTAGNSHNRCPHRTVNPHHDGTWTCLDCNVTYRRDQPLCRTCLHDPAHHHDRLCTVCHNHQRQPQLEVHA